ncbi:MAG: 3-methyladenine DNA glycosylase [Dermabacter sp.]|nr:3-methyladenine DNA glycosylase [Dermabacter sp.]
MPITAPDARPAAAGHPAPGTVLSADQARAEREAHAERADRLTAGHRERKAAGIAHPVEDFLYTYYPFSPSLLRRWHPGWQVGYDPAADAEHSGVADVQADGSRTWYADAPDAPVRRADTEAFLAARGDAVAWIVRLLEASTLASRRPNFGCYGLHEWAMVYRQKPGERRHSSLPLRLSREQTDRVVQEHSLACTHVDAFRFFTPEAVGLNAVQLTRATQIQRENPACLHAGMDLYKWAMKLVPLVPSSLALDCFEHARQIRVLDMEASPYDCRGLGYAVVAIETPEGKAEYVRRQRELATRSDELRAQLLDSLMPLTPHLPEVWT